MFQRMQGASTVEAMLILPLVIWLALAALQLLWIFWAQQTLHNTGHFVLRAGQLAGGNATTMNNVLATGMASTALQWYAQAEDDNSGEPRQSALQATAKALMHGRLAAKLIRHSPSDAQAKAFGEQRFSLREQSWVDEIAIDHALARAAGFDADKTQEWLSARQLDIEIWWCLPLQVPLVAPVLQSWWQLADNPAQRFCRYREMLLGKPLWPLVTRHKGPMMSGYRLNH